MEPKDFDKKIRDDTFRTFKGDADFWAKVSEESLVRVLNAIAVDFGYVQGMNVLLGPLIFVMAGEAAAEGLTMAEGTERVDEDSYQCMAALLRTRIPRYVLKNLDGAQEGVKLFSRCLQIVDPALYSHLTAKIPDLSIFALRYVLTLFANAKPLSEVLRLWDAIFLLGAHFNLLLLCAKLMRLRDSLLKEKRGSK